MGHAAYATEQGKGAHAHGDGRQERSSELSTPLLLASLHLRVEGEQVLLDFLGTGT